MGTAQPVLRKVTDSWQTEHSRILHSSCMTQVVPGAARVLVVDDEQHITDLVAMALRYEGFEVATANSGLTAIQAVADFSPQAIVLDVMLPDLDGFEVTRRLGARGHHPPVLFLTARDSTDDKVRGLTVGGDDYVTKPFSIEELVARIRVLLRRHETGTHENVLRYADLEMDDDAHEVRRGEKIINLTATEYRLLRYLLANPRRVLTRQQILDHVWEYDFGGDGRVLETYISYLRKKVDDVEPHLIHTVRGVGYVMRVPRS
jgi:two-component system OmpR family response regulator